MTNGKARTQTVITVIVIALIGYVAYRLVLAWGGGVPRDFADARAQGALIAQNIVNETAQFQADLTKINELDRQGKFTEALALTTEVASSSPDIRDQAVELSNQLMKMTQALNNLGLVEARQLALNSISNRLALLSELISYDADISKLLEALRGRFIGAHTTSEITALVNQINSDVSAINNYNMSAADSMQKFDALTK